ncbi:MAG TPA: type II toxin-antitoxin system CcdA family antitoxin [Phenylobacterium sp.]|uniref:type II toxin-antitoxin system CcdA family antitoxin n=1 Tax=Phenylobacterium sp. TaxID=1871053 RepID=UPI002BC6CED6|nr:type II toxin-antitoxin system CcdA family antitoxin [Phenylobacterium sp.]HSV03897.1 type II toxin-antitoxin system CcdA family antitoxin [Phenylobacterium sp.]
MGKAELRIEVDADALKRAQAKGLDLQRIAQSAVEQAVRELSVQEQQTRWIEENADAFDDYNRRIRERGLIGSEFRKW